LNQEAAGVCEDLNRRNSVYYRGDREATLNNHGWKNEPCLLCYKSNHSRFWRDGLVSAAALMSGDNTQCGLRLWRGRPLGGT